MRLTDMCTENNLHGVYKLLGNVVVHCFDYRNINNIS